MARPIKLLLIDDSRKDQILEKILLEQVFYAVVVDVQQEVPDSLEKMFDDYDGIILDEMLASGVSGTDIARQIHELDWRIPIMMVTAMNAPNTRDALMYVDQIAHKDDQVDMILKATAFVRGISRLKDGV